MNVGVVAQGNYDPWQHIYSLVGSRLPDDGFSLASVENRVGEMVEKAAAKKDIPFEYRAWSKYVEWADLLVCFYLPGREPGRVISRYAIKSLNGDTHWHAITPDTYQEHADVIQSLTAMWRKHGVPS